MKPLERKMSYKLREDFLYCSPMKSTMRRPSEYLPAGIPKKVSPLGGGACPNAAERPPVSEFESPKLKMAGNSHGGDEADSSPENTSSTVVSVRARRELQSSREAIEATRRREE